MKIRRLHLYVGILISVILVVFSYIYHPNNSACVIIKNWSNFGSYFYNYITPILAIINIVVLYELTITVSNVDKSRTQAELNLQKNLLLLKYRKEAINTFYTEMADFFDIDYIKDENKVTSHTSEFLTRFINLDLPFFNFGEHQQNIERNFQSLIVDINLLHISSKESGQINHERWLKISNKKEELLKLLKANAVGLTNVDIEHLVSTNKEENPSNTGNPNMG